MREVSLTLLILGVLLSLVAGLPHRVYGEGRDVSGLCIECHPKTKEWKGGKEVHRPVATGECSSCHNPHASKHKGLLKEGAGELCYLCHDSKKGFTGKVVHAPVAKGECLSCHRAHVSENKPLLTKPLEEGCFDCHPRDRIMAKKVVHPEVRKGNCLACHLPHSSSNFSLLRKGPKGVCVDCHSEDARLASSHLGYDVTRSNCLSCHSAHASDKAKLVKAFIHKPVEEGRCTTCHLERSSALKKKGVELCLDCHQSSMASFNRLYSHLIPGRDKDPCGTCHDPHGAEDKALLKDKERRICFSCHRDTESDVARSRYIHPKVKEGRCSACHTAHGSNNAFFLAKGKGTCSVEGCHPTQGRFTHPVGEKVIDPRSGMAMDCSTCHNPMGSKEEFILRAGKDRELCVQCHQM